MGTEYCGADAVSTGRLRFVQWLVESDFVTLSYRGAYLMRKAANHNQLHVIVWLRDQGVQYDHELCRNHSAYGIVPATMRLLHDGPYLHLPCVQPPSRPLP
jgi:hypothetical protein